MSVHGSAFQFPPKQQALFDRAKRLEWISIIFLVTIIAAIGLVMGSSQAMKTGWIEDLLSLVPPIAFLIGARYRDRDPTDEYPYGYRRAGLVAYLTGAVALLGFGLYILIESATTFISAQRPSIGTIELFGTRVWLGWLMIAVLVYSVIPPLILGRMKTPLAVALHDKTLFTDAKLNKGDWLTGIAGIAGIIGIGFGLWWADAAAAAMISIEIIRDGVTDLQNSIAQLMNKRPTQVATKEKDPVVDEVKDALCKLDWVR